MNDFERALLEALLVGPLDVLKRLGEQIDSATVLSRELSGTGFFLNFEVPRTVPRVEPPNFEISDVYFDLEGTEHGGGAILFIRDGVVTMLEAYCHWGAWPAEPAEFKLHYFDGEERDIAKVAAEISSRATRSRKAENE
ncbi:MAG TPA: hypothetical protein VH087_04200 [Thermoanaerobaculia bacterium]|jgi:hypothetical protein|nr:hypothetical protein [Thermoanaerobaculia bacterium]